MPFLVSETISTHQTEILAFRSEIPQSGTTFVTWEKAQELTKQKKRVLIFDELLGLKNTPIRNKKEQYIPQVFSGKLPLTCLIDTKNNIDFISGVATTNLNALDIYAQNQIKNQLENLIHNYDFVCLDSPVQRKGPFIPPTQTYWICAPDQQQILKTLTQAKQTDHLVLNKISENTDLTWLFSFIKQNCLQIQISKQIHLQKNCKILNETHEKT